MERSECDQLSMEHSWGAHSTFPRFPVSLPPVKGRPAATGLPVLKLGKLNFCLTLLVSIGFRGVSLGLEQNIFGWIDGSKIR
jgi:hypothetical protein